MLHCLSQARLLWFWIYLTMKGVGAEAACRDGTMTDVPMFIGVWRWKSLCTYVTSVGDRKSVV